MGRYKVILLLSNETDKLPPIDRRSMVKVLREILNQTKAGSGAWEISLSLVDDPAMRALNHKHRGIDRTTDVLSFPQFSHSDEITPEPEGNIVIGDIVISLETLNRRCESRGERQSIEFTRQLIHGLLHLLGYDHGASKERHAMRAFEDAVIDRLSGQTV